MEISLRGGSLSASSRGLLRRFFDSLVFVFVFALSDLPLLFDLSLATLLAAASSSAAWLNGRSEGAREIASGVSGGLSTLVASSSLLKFGAERRRRSPEAAAAPSWIPLSWSSSACCDAVGDVDAELLRDVVEV